MRRLIHSQTATGGTHLRKKLPCQDHAIAVSLDGAQILVVADGHGNRRHFRSERGSQFACQAAQEAIERLLVERPDADAVTQECLIALGREIVERWRELVAADLEAEPWTDAELEEERELLPPQLFEQLIGGESDLIPYGTTLVAAFTTPEFWAGVQVGDGMLVALDADGNYIWPMPESAVNEGNRTASLCMDEPEVRVCMGTSPIVGLFACTDGIEKAYPAQGEKVVKALYWLWRALQDERAEKLLGEAAEQLATQSAIKDDVGFALMADLDAEDVAPKPTEAQLLQREEQFQGKWDELVSVIRFNQRQLAETHDPGIAGQLRASLAQCRQDLQQLLEICPNPDRFILSPDLMCDEPPEEKPEGATDDAGAQAGEPEECSEAFDAIPDVDLEYESLFMDDIVGFEEIQKPRRVTGATEMQARKGSPFLHGIGGLFKYTK